MKQHLNKGFNKDIDDKRYEIISKFFKGKSVLEVGCAEGHFTKRLLKKFKNVTVIEPDRRYQKDILKLSGVTWIPEELEEVSRFQIKSYDTVICTNVLEHILDIDVFLDHLKKFGNKKTTFVFTIPNALSFNRMHGVEKGLMKNYYSLHKNDKKVGHKQMYCKLSLYAKLQYNGFKVERSGTYIYKPFPNDMMEKLPKELKKFCLDSMMDEYGAEACVVARKI